LIIKSLSNHVEKFNINSTNVKGSKNLKLMFAEFLFIYITVTLKLPGSDERN